MQLISRIAWLAFGATLAIYALMVFVTLPRIAAEAGGLVPFDLRPLGYTWEEAAAFLKALTASGKDIYLTVQHRLDFAYPGLLALTLALAIVLLAPASWRRFRWIVALLAVPGAVFDYLENAAIAKMLNTAPDSLPSELVDTASTWTILKSVTTSVTMIVALLLMIGWFYRRLAGRRF